jgi:hypothetical protein
MMSRKDYLKHMQDYGVLCPECMHNVIEDRGCENCGTCVEQELACTNCGAEWRLTLKVVDFEILRSGKP